jgi:hypothetical protein
MKKSELRQLIREEISKKINSPSNTIQSKLKELAGYWPADIKNNLDKLGAEKFKSELDNLKSQVDLYFKEKL